MAIARFRPRGIVGDIPPSETGPEAWSSGQGIEFRNGFGTRSQGWLRVFGQCPGTPQWLLNVPYQGVNYWFACCEEGIYRTDTTSWTDVTPADFSGAGGYNRWTGGILNGIPVFNCANDADPPYYHDWNDNTTKVLPNWPGSTTVRALRPFKFHLFGFDITQAGVRFPDQMIWSDSAAPGNVPQSWTPTAANDAGDQALSDTESPIVDAHILRGALYVYKARSVYQISYVGGTFVFSARSLFTNAGVLTRNCAVEFQGKAYVLADGDAYVHDGQSFKSLLWGRAQRLVFDQIDAANFVNSFVCADRANNEIYFGIPPNGFEIPTVAITYNVNTDSIGVREIGSTAHMAQGVVTEGGASDAWEDDPESWESDNTIWNQVTFNPADDGVLMAQYDGTAGSEWISLLDGAQNRPDSVPLVTRATKTDVFFDMPTEYKLVTRVWPRVTELGGSLFMQVRVGAADNDGGPISWYGPVNFDPKAQAWCDFLVQGRYLSFEFQTTDGENYTLEGFDVEFEQRGQF